ncbi:hypothetical protein [uncultured Schumannella sp.]|uniref:hypothetical protein n=1 Tax=uncultured Schumannella sp. TaxID=1195956 RepID=UPI0025E11EC7|nr:hypothetical protein [uncultured Schumannella sp.]
MSITTSAPAEPTHQHPPHADAAPARIPRPVRRVGLLDRAALRLGVLLITWSRRSSLSRDAARSRVETARAIEARELAAERRRLLTLPPR